MAMLPVGAATPVSTDPSLSESGSPPTNNRTTPTRDAVRREGRVSTEDRKPNEKAWTRTDTSHPSGGTAKTFTETLRDTRKGDGAPGVPSPATPAALPALALPSPAATPTPALLTAAQVVVVSATPGPPPTAPGKTVAPGIAAGAAPVTVSTPPLTAATLTRAAQTLTVSTPPATAPAQSLPKQQASQPVARAQAQPGAATAARPGATVSAQLEQASLQKGILGRQASAMPQTVTLTEAPKQDSPLRSDGAAVSILSTPAPAPGSSNIALAADAKVALATPAERADVIRQITESAASTANSAGAGGRHTVALTVTPGHWGELKIQLAMPTEADAGAGGVTATIVAQSSAVRDALLGQAKELRASLQSAGVKLDKLEVVVASASSAQPVAAAHAAPDSGFQHNSQNNGHAHAGSGSFGGFGADTSSQQQGQARQGFSSLGEQADFNGVRLPALSAPAAVGGAATGAPRTSAPETGLNILA